jgi:hypothetical protein
MEYGGEFADFLEAFPPARELAYLADVARFEWLMNRAAHATDAEPASVDALAQVAPEDAERLMFRLDPSLGYLASPFPVDAIWRANRSCDSDDAAIDLAGGVHWKSAAATGTSSFASSTGSFRLSPDSRDRSAARYSVKPAFAIDPEFSEGRSRYPLHEGAIASALPPLMGSLHDAPCRASIATLERFPLSVLQFLLRLSLRLCSGMRVW